MFIPTLILNNITIVIDKSHTENKFDSVWDLFILYLSDTFS